RDGPGLLKTFTTFRVEAYDGTVGSTRKFGLTTTVICIEPDLSLHTLNVGGNTTLNGHLTVQGDKSIRTKHLRGPYTGDDRTLIIDADRTGVAINGNTEFTTDTVFNGHINQAQNKTLRTANIRPVVGERKTLTIGSDTDSESNNAVVIRHATTADKDLTIAAGGTLRANQFGATTDVLEMSTTGVVSWKPYTGSQNQSFNIVNQNDGSKGIRRKYSPTNLALQMNAGDGSVSGTTYNGNQGQSFIIDTQPNGSSSIRRKYNPALALDMSEGIVKGKTYTGSQEQSFSIANGVIRRFSGVTFSSNATLNGNVNIASASIVGGLFKGSSQKLFGGAINLAEYTYRYQAAPCDGFLNARVSTTSSAGGYDSNSLDAYFSVTVETGGVRYSVATPQQYLTANGSPPPRSDICIPIAQGNAVRVDIGKGVHTPGKSGGYVEFYWMPLAGGGNLAPA
ncbi:RICIN domain-containing protein, partial [Streptomyces sp. NPDC001667]